MAINEKMTAIANAIRSKTGGTDKLTLDSMVVAINNISTSSPTELLWSYTGDTQPSGTVIDASTWTLGTDEVLIAVCIPNATSTYADDKFPTFEHVIVQDGYWSFTAPTKRNLEAMGKYDDWNVYKREYHVDLTAKTITLDSGASSGYATGLDSDCLVRKIVKVKSADLSS